MFEDTTARKVIVYLVYRMELGEKILVGVQGMRVSHAYAAKLEGRTKFFAYKGKAHVIETERVTRKQGHVRVNQLRQKHGLTQPRLYNQFVKTMFDEVTL